MAMLHSNLYIRCSTHLPTIRREKKLSIEMELMEAMSATNVYLKKRKNFQFHIKLCNCPIIIYIIFDVITYLFLQQYNIYFSKIKKLKHRTTL